MDTNINILDKLKIYQNTLWLIVAFAFIYFSDHISCSCIKVFSYIVFAASSISVLICLIFYTCSYSAKRILRIKCHKLRLDFKEQIFQKYGQLPPNIDSDEVDVLTKIDNLLKCN